MNKEKILKLAKEYTDEKVKEQEERQLQQIMASHELRLSCSRNSSNAIFLSCINLILWITTIVLAAVVFLCLT